tara:strand:+ start:583 stop:1053 length:471 start_codon:yes stop_codon:yes gene_type:complete
MPNWCKNRVTVWSSMSDKETDQLNRIKEIFSSKDTVFGKIIPSPDWATIPNEDGELPTVREHKNPKTGEVSFVTTEFPKSGKQDSRWYDWNLQNWDTKWDVVNSVEVDAEEDMLELNFNTAWSPPESVCHKLREMFPDVSIQWFYDEPGMEIAGYL